MPRAALVSLLLLFGACDYHRIEESTRESFRFPEPGGVTVARIEVRIENGSLRVVPGVGDGVEIVVEKRARAVDERAARAALEEAAIELGQEGETVLLRSLADERGFGLGAALRTDVELRVPPSSPELVLETRDGRITLRDVSALVAAETGDGRIRASGVGGELRLRTKDGSIRVTDLDGTLDAWSGDGRVEVDGRCTRLSAVTADGSIRVSCGEGSRVDDGWQLRSLDGSITLRLPESLSAELEAVAVDGRLSVELDGFRGLKREGRVEGVLGEGGARILVTAMDGSIEIERR